MLFAALDVHKKEIEAVLLNEAGQVLLRQRVATDRMDGNGLRPTMYSLKIWERGQSRLHPFDFQVPFRFSGYFVGLQ